VIAIAVTLQDTFQAMELFDHNNRECLHMASEV